MALSYHSLYFLLSSHPRHSPLSAHLQSLLLPSRDSFRERKRISRDNRARYRSGSVSLHQDLYGQFIVIPPHLVLWGFFPPKTWRDLVVRRFFHSSRTLNGRPLFPLFSHSLNSMREEQPTSTMTHGFSDNGRKRNSKSDNKIYV